jgi:hypothetical protein
MADFKERLPNTLPKRLNVRDALIVSGEAYMPTVLRKQYEKAVCAAEKRAATLRQKTEKTEGRLARSRLEEAAARAENAATEMRKKIAELG